ncbi:MAG: hypothetical protein ACI351_03700 [Candidatus Avelusimicrobium sp.]|uniref:hypothetical protein n=1 Tax=Candidatus Avelusimicrobium sp. TaxID=3048833 RepID=UPI003F0B3D02
MKKLYFAVFILLSSCVCAEEMQFITVLSSPVGSFNRLEAVDYSAPAQGTTVNFCTKIGTGGKVQLKGNNNVDIENTNLSPNTTLGRSNAGDYVLQKITLNSAGELEGSRLLSKVVNVSGQGVGKSNNLYGTTLTVAGAKATTLNVNNGASQITAQHEAADMVWSNEYQADKACGTNCAQQYLLKSKGQKRTCNPKYGQVSLSSEKFEYSYSFSGVDFAQDTCDGKITYGQFSCSTEDFNNKKVCVDYFAATSNEGCEKEYPGEWVVWPAQDIAAPTETDVMDYILNQVYQAKKIRLTKIDKCPQEILSVCAQQYYTEVKDVCPLLPMHGSLESPGFCAFWWRTNPTETSEGHPPLYRVRALYCEGPVTKCPARMRNVECCPD